MDMISKIFVINLMLVKRIEFMFYYCFIVEENNNLN